MIYLIKILKKEFLIYSRKSSSFISPVVFFLISISLYPIGISNDPDILKNLAPGLIWITVISSLIFVIQLASLQLSGDSFDRDFAVQEISVYPERGLIYDRNNHLLVANTKAYDIMIIPKQIDKIYYNYQNINCNKEIFQIKFDFLEFILQNYKNFNFKKNGIINPIYISNNKILN